MTVLCVNKKARYNYTIVSTFEAGIVLVGSEVKALRQGRGQIVESFASFYGHQLILRNVVIGACSYATNNHEERRSRILLCWKKELRRLKSTIEQKKYTLVPLSIYSNPVGKIKVEMACVIGKKNHEKRDTIKQRDWERKKQRFFRHTS